jgi:hypothetical protein
MIAPAPISEVAARLIAVRSMHNGGLDLLRLSSSHLLPNGHCDHQFRSNMPRLAAYRPLLRWHGIV